VKSEGKKTRVDG